ncbi:natural killer cell receptor 2B4 isoform X2 [Echinops telfairi]|uniref:Natural killer cell receptor 2B4 isoform X2 n=1 Tax=Echinops telfairi TaxID=9371 RepID=A0AC55DRM6_ECHTE|nr:natural killer cell receptor 2B4 isoform X2 [Echinops telfairi]
MLGRSLMLTCLLLLLGHRGQECLGCTEYVLRLSGTTLHLRPCSTFLLENIDSAKWKVRFHSKPTSHVILTQKNGYDVHRESWVLNHFNKRHVGMCKDLTLFINASQRQDSGIYYLDVTLNSGKINSSQFHVTIFDHVEKPHLQEQEETLVNGMCQVTLSCSVSKDENVSYAWYRGSELIQTSRNRTYRVEQIDVGVSHTYTCNVSNPVSWANHTLSFTQGCQNAHQKSTFLLYPMIIMVLLFILFSGTLTYFYVCKRKRKQPRHNAEECLTVYEDINNLRVGTNQEQEQHPSGEGSTIYTRLQPQPESEVKNQSPSFNSTIYDKVGEIHIRSQNPSRLSLKELQSFQVYS